MRIVVIGAGILGASTAFHLARSGAAVVVVDHAHAGRATAAGAGIICPWVADAPEPDFYRLYAAGAQYYPTLLAALGEAETGYRHTGALCVSDSSDALDAIEALARRRAAAAPEAGEILRLSPAEARRRFPPLRPDFAAVRITGGARVDGRRLAAALLRAAEAAGAECRPGLASLSLHPGGAPLVWLDGEALAADAVVVTAGAWAPALLRPLGLALAIAPQRGQIVHLHLPGAATGEWPVILPPGSHYLLAFDDSRVVVGATRETGAGFDHRLTAGGMAEVLAEALRVAPGLADATLAETRIGFRPIAADGLPMLGGAPGVPGLFIGNGLGPSGLTIGPYAGALLAALAVGETPALPLDRFAPFRSVTPQRSAALR